MKLVMVFLFGAILGLFTGGYIHKAAITDAVTRTQNREWCNAGVQNTMYEVVDFLGLDKAEALGLQQAFDSARMKCWNWGYWEPNENH